MENKEVYEAFLKRVDNLSAGDRVALKRSAGTMISEAPGKAMTAFYRCAPLTIPQWQEDRWFAIACVKCLWDPIEGNSKPIEAIIAELINNSELSASMEHRVEALLDTAWDQDGYMLTKLCRMMKLLRQKAGTEPDFEALLEDVIYWNNESQSVQRKWARRIFSTTDL